MLLRASLVLSAVIPCALVVACSSSESAPIRQADATEAPDAGPSNETPARDGGGSDAKPPPPPKDECTTLAEAQCAREATCRKNAFVIEYGAAATCVTKKREACEVRLGANGSAYEKSDATACAKALPSLSCDELLIGKVPAACRPPAGKLAIGAGCADDAQCATGVCLFEDEYACGKCSEKRPPNQLQRCSSTAQCPTGEACRSASADVMKSGICRAIVGEGEYCSSAVCGAGLYCVSGTCTATREVGETCGPFYGPCDPAKGYACDLGGGTDKCIAPAVKFALDDACDSSGLCEVGTWCKAYPGFGVAACTALPESGESCTTLCAPPARCAGYGAARKCVIETPSTCK